MSGSVLLDTDVYGAVYVTPDKAERQGHPVGRWRRALEGVRVFISFQTRAEVLAGAASSGWGERRVHELRAQLDATPTITADVAVVDACAQLQERAAGRAMPSRTSATLLIVGMLLAPSRRGSLCSRGTASTLMCPAWRCSARVTCSDCAAQ